MDPSVLPDIHHQANTLTHLERIPLKAPITTETLSQIRHTAYRTQNNYYVNSRVQPFGLRVCNILIVSLKWLYTVASISGFAHPITSPTFNLYFNILSQLTNSSLCTHIQ